MRGRTRKTTAVADSKAAGVFRACELFRSDCPRRKERLDHSRLPPFSSVQSLTLYDGLPTSGDCTLPRRPRPRCRIGRPGIAIFCGSAEGARRPGPDTGSKKITPALRENSRVFFTCTNSIPCLPSSRSPVIGERRHFMPLLPEAPRFRFVERCGGVRGMACTVLQADRFASGETELFQPTMKGSKIFLWSSCTEGDAPHE